MVRHSLILFFILVSIAPRCYPQNINNDDNLREIVSQYGQAEVFIPYTSNENIDLLTRNTSVYSVRNKNIYISLSPISVDWFIQQKFNYTILKNNDVKGIVTALNLDQAMEWETYPTYSQYDAIMQKFLADYPSLCHLDTIGTSIRGRQVFALKISDNPGIDETEPEVFYSSTMHGDETGGFVLMLRLADYLLKNYSTDERVRNIVNNLEVWINPNANPDGTYGTGNTISYPTRDNANGVDLNRNFPDPFQPGEIQQKENIDMMKFLRDRRFVLSANFHAGSEVVNYPWDRWLSKLHADNSWFETISRAYADTVHNYSVESYMNYMDNGVTRGAEWYVIYGGRQDYVTWELQGREVTIELDYTKQTPAAQLELLWQYNYRSLLGYIENALYGIHGLVKNSVTDAPVAAKIYIAGYDKDSSQVYSDTLSGRFVRMLEPGLWDLIFKATGYTNDTVKSISVIQGQETEIVVNMVQEVNSVDKTCPDNLFLYPNPSATEIRVVLPSGILGDVNMRIINQSGMIVSEHQTEVIYGSPVIIDVRCLAAGVYIVLFTNTYASISYWSRFIVIK